MGPEAFRRLLAGLASAPGTGDRRALRLVDDERLEWGSGDEPDVIVREFPEKAHQAPGEWPNGQAENLLADFYRTHPVSRTGCDRQRAGAVHGTRLAGIRGAARKDRVSPCSWTAVASSHSPRHRYGAYCELPAPLDPDAASAKVESWLASGEACASYLGMNVCRYNC